MHSPDIRTRAPPTTEVSRAKCPSVHVNSNSVPSPAQWERLQPLIEQLYLYENCSILQTIEYLRRHYNFFTTESIFEGYVRKWGIYKKEKTRRGRKGTVSAAIRQQATKWHDPYAQRYQASPKPKFMTPDTSHPGELTAKLLGHYIDHCFDTGVWVAGPSVGGFRSTKNPGDHSSVDALYDYFLAAIDLFVLRDSSTMDRGGEYINNAFEAIPGVLRDEDPYFLVTIWELRMYSRAQELDELGRKLLRHVFDLGRVLLGANHPIPNINKALLALEPSTQFQIYLLLLKVWADKLMEHLLPRDPEAYETFTCGLYCLLQDIKVASQPLDQPRLSKPRNAPRFFRRSSSPRTTESTGSAPSHADESWRDSVSCSSSYQDALKDDDDVPATPATPITLVSPPPSPKNEVNDEDRDDPDTPEQPSPEDLASTPMSTACSPGFDNDTAYMTDAKFSDSEASWVSDYSELVPHLEDSHPLFKVKTEVLKLALLRLDCVVSPRDSGNVREVSHQAANTQNNSYSSAPNNKPSNAQSGQSNAAKRARGSGGRKEDQEDDEEREPPKKRHRTTKQSIGRQVSLACPFAKQDATHYRGCYSYVLRRIQDVKQHLSRCHQLPIYCPRCKETFGTENERDDHAINTVCEVRNDVTLAGVTRAQKDLLAERLSPRMSLKDQWFAIFDILFPGHTPRPASPFLDTSLTADLMAFQDMMVSDGPDLILSTLEAHNIVLSSLGNEEKNLSNLYRVVIAEGMQAIAERWTAAMAPQSANAEGSQPLQRSRSSATNAASEESPSALADNDSGREQGSTQRNPRSTGRVPGHADGGPDPQRRLGDTASSPWNPFSAFGQTPLNVTGTPSATSLTTITPRDMDLGAETSDSTPSTVNDGPSRLDDQPPAWYDPSMNDESTNMFLLSSENMLDSNDWIPDL
ncbi:hypothetical protein GQ53DRAFT_756116 [Thozetella sp. PMI_491]|nr:hypothetical protein GQ53DRAFT_756116 [Thozetella sp. PMI_491]